MTKTEFERAMNCGLGRCIEEAKSCSDKSKYFPVVLKGCFRTLAYDTQAEGTRAEYLYRLIQALHNDGFFLPPILEKLKTADVKEDWLFAQLVELVALFAKENQDALNGLKQSYSNLYAALEKVGGEYNFERDAYERVAIALTKTEGFDRYKSVAFDIGKLFLKNQTYEAFDFEWFHLCFYKHFIVLKNQAEKGDCAPELFRFYQAYKEVPPLPDLSPRTKKRTAKPISSDLRKMLYPHGERDEVHFFNALKKLNVSYRNHRWHGVYLDIIRCFEDGVPSEALTYVYNQSLCSCCRLEAVKLMKACGSLSQEIKAECKSDSNGDIRALFE